MINMRHRLKRLREIIGGVFMLAMLPLLAFIFWPYGQETDEQ